MTDMMMRYAKAYNAFMTGNFDQGMKLLKNESGLMMSDFVGKAKQLQKRIREGASVEDLMEDRAFYDLLESSILSSAMKQGATRFEAEEVLNRFKTGEKAQRDVGQLLYATGVGTREIDMLREFLGTKDLTASDATKEFNTGLHELDINHEDMTKVFELLEKRKNKVKKEKDEKDKKKEVEKIKHNLDKTFFYSTRIPLFSEEFSTKSPFHYSFWSQSQPKIEFEAVLAHELLHVWIKKNNIKLPKNKEEGF